MKGPSYEHRVSAYAASRRAPATGIVLGSGRLLSLRRRLAVRREGGQAADLSWADGCNTVAAEARRWKRKRERGCG